MHQEGRTQSTIYFNQTSSRKKVKTIGILRSANKAALAIAELKGSAQTIPNQKMLVML